MGVSHVHMGINVTCARGRVTCARGRVTCRHITSHVRPEGGTDKDRDGMGATSMDAVCATGDGHLHGCCTTGDAHLHGCCTTGDAHLHGCCMYHWRWPPPWMLYHWRCPPPWMLYVPLEMPTSIWTLCHWRWYHSHGPPWMPTNTSHTPLVLRGP